MSDSNGDSTRVPGFVLFERVGHGGFGEVYRAADASPFRGAAAIKIINPHPFQDSHSLHERFLREAEAIRRLSHGGIVRYQGSGLTTENPQHPFLAMDYVDGVTLRDAARSLPFEGRVSLMIDVLDALNYAHANGILHRDIKPTNILVRSSDKRPVIVDFGLAYVFEGISSDALTTHYIGSLGYIPQEVQVTPALRNVQHDVFSCGVSLYEICAGRKPNPQTYLPLSEINNDLSSLDPIIRRALDAPDKRFKTADDFAEALRRWYEASQQRASLPQNSMASEMRRRLLDRQQRNASRIAAERSAQDAVDQIWNEKHSLIIGAAQAAFRGVTAQLGDLLPDYRLEEKVPAGALMTLTGKREEEPVELLVFRDSKTDFRVVFGIAKDFEVPLGRSGQRIPLVEWPDRQSSARVQGPQTPSEGLYLPGWVVYTEGSNQAPRRILVSGIVLAAGPAPKLFARGYAERHGSIAFPQPPQEVQSAMHVRDYITAGLAIALHLEEEDV